MVIILHENQNKMILIQVKDQEPITIKDGVEVVVASNGIWLEICDRVNVPNSGIAWVSDHGVIVTIHK